MSKSKLPRRDFIKSGSLLAASSLFIPNIIRADNLGGQKLRVAVIGVGGRGRAHVGALAGEQLVAFCDVDDKRAAKTYEKYPKVPRFKDYRVMFDKMRNEIDAVSISVPDHMHYPIAMWAIAEGKHLLCEKPLVRTVEEAMALKKATAESGLITQMGNQGHAYNGLREIQEWRAAGLIGDVHQVYHWTDRPIWPQGDKVAPAPAAIPSTMAWDLWLGVAPKVDYSPDIAPFNWRGFWDYGSGAIGDIACHAMDASYTSLNLGYPTEISAESPDTTDIAFPSESTIRYTFPAKGGRPEVKLTWMDGGRRPKHLPFIPNDFIPENKAANRKGQANGTVLLGTKGAIFAGMYAKRPRLFPNDYFRELRMNDGLPPATLPRVGKSHFMEWADGCKTGIQPGGNIPGYAADFTATALLGTIALKNPGPLKFDASTMTFEDNAEANAMIKSQYAYRKEFLPS